MKRIFLAYFMIFSIFSTFSLTKDEVFHRLSKNSERSGQFVQTKTISKLNRKLKSSGNYRFSSEEISWITEKPFPSTLTITEKSMIQKAPNGKETVMDFSQNPVFSSIAKTIKSIFSNESSQIEKYFSVEFKSEGDNWEIKLVPLDATINSAIKVITVKGKALEKSAEIEFMEIAEAFGDFISYEFY